jgi:hypothetical protein
VKYLAPSILTALWDGFGYILSWLFAAGTVVFYLFAFISLAAIVVAHPWLIVLLLLCR